MAITNSSNLDDTIYVQGIDLSVDWDGPWQDFKQFNSLSFSVFWDSPSLDLKGTLYLDLAIANYTGLGGGTLDVDTDMIHTAASLVIDAGVQPDGTSLWLTDPISSAVNAARLRYVADGVDPGEGTLKARYFSKSWG